MKTLRITVTQTLRQHTILLLLAAFSICLLLVRGKITHSVFYFFLIWNLFLAYTPLAVVSYLQNDIKLMERKLWFYLLFFSWLVLLPNAPYLITDFIHLKKESTVPVWFDVLLLISFSVSGLLFGLTSMKKMFTILMVKFNPLLSWFIMALVCVLSGFGIYMGRFLRFNSWDILHKPFEVINTVFLSLNATDTFRTAWGVTFGFGCLMFLLFHLFCSPGNEKNL